MRKAVLSLLLWTWTGTNYFFAEVVFKTLCGRPETISWTLLALAILLAIPLERFGAELPWDCPLWLQALICGTAIVAAELAAGLVLNIWLGMAIWDYSALPGNLWGQICPQFWALWCLLSLPMIVILDWLRYAVEGGETPRYTMRFYRRITP